MQLECLLQYGLGSDTQAWHLPWFYSISFNVVSIVLLLNMLIAMMAKVRAQCMAQPSQRHTAAQPHSQDPR